MSAVEERTYVEEARREKRAALEARGRPRVRLPVRAHPHGAPRRVALYRDEMGDQGPDGRRRGPHRLARARQGKTSVLAISRTAPGGSSSTSATDALGEQL